MRHTRGVKSCGEEQHPRRYVFVKRRNIRNTAPNIMMCEAFIVRLSDAISPPQSLRSMAFVFPQAPGLLSHGIRSGLESTTLCISQDQMSQPLEDQQGYRAHALSVHQCLMSSSISYDPWQASLLKVAGSSHLSWTHRCTPRKWNWNKGSIYSHPSWELDICSFLSLLVQDLADQADFQASPSLRWLILTQIRISRI